MDKTIVCFGDSNTHGYCAETTGRFNKEQRWPRLLQTYLGSEYLVIEEGLCGRTTVFDDPLHEGLSGLDTIFHCLMSHQPVDLLIIMLGTNDVKERFHMSPANIAKGMGRLIQKARSIDEAWHHTPNILLISPPAILQDYTETAIADEMGRGCVQKSIALARHFQETAKTFDCHFLDANTLTDVTMSPLDCMHLTLESHDALASHLAQLIPTLQNKS